jgi:hypothetical protein
MSALVGIRTATARHDVKTMRRGPKGFSQTGSWTDKLLRISLSVPELTPIATVADTAVSNRASSSFEGTPSMTIRLTLENIKARRSRLLG